MSVVALLSQLITFYIYLIIAHAILSWFRPSGILGDIYGVLGTITDPFVGIFRRIVPLAGGIDFSPLVAIIVLQLVQRAIITALR